MSSLNIKQQSNFDGFPKAAELIEISGDHGLEALDRANLNQLLQIARDRDGLMEPGASREVTLTSPRRAASKHESNDRIRESLRGLRRTEVKVRYIRYISTKTGKPRKLETYLLTFTDTDEENTSDARISFRCSTRPQCARTYRRAGAKGGRRMSPREVARWFSTKIHLTTDFDGLPIAFLLTGGAASDSSQIPALLEIGPDVYPRAALADKGYDSQVNRQVAPAHGVCPAIPYRSSVKNQPKFFPKVLYAGRARIEITVGKIKRFKWIELRCEKTAMNFASLMAFVLAISLVKSFNTA